MILTHLVLFSFLGGAGSAPVAPPVIVIQQAPGHGSNKTWREVVAPKKRRETAIPELVFKPVPKTVRFYLGDIPWPISPERSKADRRQKRLQIVETLVKRRKRAAIAALIMELYGT